jgi:hypothetical protein
MLHPSELRLTLNELRGTLKIDTSLAHRSFADPCSELPVYSSAEWFGKAFREFASIFHFCSTDRNSELFSLPWKGSELNSESFLIKSYVL